MVVISDTHAYTPHGLTNTHISLNITECYCDMDFYEYGAVPVPPFHYRIRFSHENFPDCLFVNVSETVSELLIVISYHL